MEMPAIWHLLDQPCRISANLNRPDRGARRVGSPGPAQLKWITEPFRGTHIDLFFDDTYVAIGSRSAAISVSRLLVTDSSADLPVCRPNHRIHRPCRSATCTLKQFDDTERSSPQATSRSASGFNLCPYFSLGQGRSQRLRRTVARQSDYPDGHGVSRRLEVRTISGTAGDLRLQTNSRRPRSCWKVWPPPRRMLS